MRIQLDIMKHRYFDLLVAALMFAIVMGVSYGGFYAPVIFSDDWSHIVGGLLDNRWPVIDWTTSRPLVHLPILLIYSLFGLNIHAFYWILFLSQWGAAVGTYSLLKKIIPNHSLVFLVVLLSFVYPADYTHTWLNMVHVRFGFVMLLLYAWLIFLYRDKNSRVALIISLLVLLVSLGIYEGHLGLALGWAVLLFLISKKLPWSRRIALLSPFVIVGFFSIWRIYGIARIGVYDSYIEQIHFSPGLFLERLWIGCKVLVWCWIVPFQQAFGGGPDFVLGYLRYYLLIAVTIILGWLIAILTGKKFSHSPLLLKDEKIREYRMAVALFVTGVLFTSLGYIPIIMLFPPNLSSLDSRVNVFALLGASLSIVALLYIFAVFLARYREQVCLLLAVSVIPLLTIGVMVQLWVQYDIKTAWSEQKLIWSELFDIAPTLTDYTHIIVVLPGYQESKDYVTWKRTPLWAEWDVTAAIKVLYGNKTLSADVFFPDLYCMMEFRPEGIASLWWYGHVIPYERTIIVTFDGEPRRLRLVEDLQTDLGLTWPTVDYKPHSRILVGAKPTVALRRLVGVASP